MKNTGKWMTFFLTLSVSLVWASDGHHTEKTLKEKPKSKWDRAVQSIGVDYQKNVEPIFKVSCFDCHSGFTSYPWYHSIPGIKGMMDGDVDKAKKNLDMSNGYPFKGNGNLESDLKAITYQVDKGKMPPLKYRVMHWKSGLTEKQKQAIEDWTGRSLDKLDQAEP